MEARTASPKSLRIISGLYYIHRKRYSGKARTTVKSLLHAAVKRVRIVHKDQIHLDGIYHACRKYLRLDVQRILKRETDIEKPESAGSA